MLLFVFSLQNNSVDSIPRPSYVEQRGGVPQIYAGPGSIETGTTGVPTIDWGTKGPGQPIAVNSYGSHASTPGPSIAGSHGNHATTAIGGPVMGPPISLPPVVGGPSMQGPPMV